MTSKQSDYKSLLQNLGAGVCRISLGAKAKIVYANQAFLDMFGLPKTALSKLKFEDLLVHKKDFVEFKKQIKTLQVLEHYEILLRSKKDKKDIWCSVFASLVEETRSRIKLCDLVVQNITARKCYEQQLVESKDLFQAVFNNTAAAITVAGKDEKLVAWNPFAEKMLGMSKKELFNLPVQNLYPAKEWRRLRAYKIREKGMKSDIRTKILKSDEEVLDVNLSLSVLKDPKGGIIGSIGIIRDITRQLAADRKIRESENKIRIILDNSAAAITLTDENERIVSWNKYTEALLGMKKKDLYLRHISTLYPEEEWKKLRAEKIRKIGSKHHHETKVTKKNGDVIDIDLSINMLTDSDRKIIGSVGIMQDITEQKKAQEMLVQAKLAAEEANSAKSLFLANMSHEVRTPMNTIMGMIDLTLDTDLDSEQKENLHVVKDAANNLLSLLNDILDLSRVEAGKIHLENIEFHLPNVIQSVMKGMSVLLREKNLELDLKMDDNVPELIIGDPVRLRQVVVNLINNAIKFTHQGTITTEISVASRKGKEVMLLISVADEGIGIPADKQKNIFEVFSQADASTTRRFGGSGLGLAISKRLVELMGGRIWVESEVSKGSKFSFTGNFVVVKEKNQSGTWEVLEMKEAVTEAFLKDNYKGLRVLLAEDNIVNQKIVVRILEKLDWNVTAVDDGKYVIEELHKNTFDLIILDANMPVLDGLETCKLIRKDEKKTGKHIPIIALTARAMQEDRKKCMDAGMDGYVPKPLNRQELYTVIGQIIKQRKEHV